MNTVSNYPSTYGLQEHGTTLLLCTETCTETDCKGILDFDSRSQIICQPRSTDKAARPPNFNTGFNLDGNTAYCYRQSRVAECLWLPEDGRLTNEGKSGRERQYGVVVAWLGGEEDGVEWRGRMVAGRGGSLSVESSSI